jgi:DNA-binding transcriptional regulator LsrR (DeoR family)/transcriptional regulator with XRE-family HTH domain
LTYYQELEMTDRNKFGLRLKELRDNKAMKLGRRKIPQREVAAALNISPGSYGSWESGRTRPDIDLLPKIAQYFEVSIDYLLGHSTNDPASPERSSNKTGLAWSLRRPAQADSEEKGIEVWRRLTEGESLEVIANALETPVLQEIERYLLDVIHTDMIRIDNLPQDTGLGEKVRQTFGLREVVVVPTAPESPSYFRYILLGEAARAYFKTHVYEGMKVGIAGGYSVSRLIYSLRPGDCRAIEVYPIAISPVVESIAVDANSLVGALAYTHYGYHVRGYCLQYASPPDWKDAKDREKIALTRRILAKAKSVDIAFMGLGTFKRRLVPIDWLGDLLDSRELSLDIIRERGAIGDILHHPVDQNGQPVASEIDDLICSIGLEDLREMVQWRVQQVVAIASDQRKAEITRAAIKGGYANVFIINDELAQAMLKAEEDRKSPTVDDGA